MDGLRGRPRCPDLRGRPRLDDLRGRPRLDDLRGRPRLRPSPMSVPVRDASWRFRSAALLERVIPISSRSLTSASTDKELRRLVLAICIDSYESNCIPSVDSLRKECQIDLRTAIQIRPSTWTRSAAASNTSIVQRRFSIQDWSGSKIEHQKHIEQGAHPGKSQRAHDDQRRDRRHWILEIVTMPKLGLGLGRPAISNCSDTGVLIHWRMSTTHNPRTRLCEAGRSLSEPDRGGCDRPHRGGKITANR